MRLRKDATKVRIFEGSEILRRFSKLSGRDVIKSLTFIKSLILLVNQFCYGSVINQSSSHSDVTQVRRLKSKLCCITKIKCAENLAGDKMMRRRSSSVHVVIIDTRQFQRPQVQQAKRSSHLSSKNGIKTSASWTQLARMLVTLKHFDI